MYMFIMVKYCTNETLIPPEGYPGVSVKCTGIPALDSIPVFGHTNETLTT